MTLHIFLVIKITHLENVESYTAMTHLNVWIAIRKRTNWSAKLVVMPWKGLVHRSCIDWTTAQYLTYARNVVSLLSTASSPLTICCILWISSTFNWMRFQFLIFSLSSCLRLPYSMPLMWCHLRKDSIASKFCCCCLCCQLRLYHLQLPPWLIPPRVQLDGLLNLHL